MSSDDNQFHHIYTRKTYKKNRRDIHSDNPVIPQDDLHVETGGTSPRSDVKSDAHTFDSPSCSCDLDTEGEIARILHKKCPVISLAQQQLQRLLDETDKLLCDNTTCCRSVYDFICICKNILYTEKKGLCFLVALIAASFFFGLLLGAASCGAHLGKFNSPILTCVDNFFIPETYTSIEATYRSIV